MEGTGAAVEWIIPANDPSSSPEIEQPHQGFDANTAAATKPQDAEWLHGTDDEGQPELFATPSELPSTPLDIPEAVDASQNGTASLAISDEKETEVSKQTMEPEADAKTLNDTTSIRSLSRTRHGSDDSGYQSMYSSENKDEVKINAAVDNILKGDVCGMRLIDF